MGKTVNIYYFHPDHLGTATFVSDANGEPYQFFLNLPFGELRSNREHLLKNKNNGEQTMAEQRAGSWENPYKFNGKELDAELRSNREHHNENNYDGEQTGLYYYGARYYNPRWSSLSASGGWLSVDPLAGKYPHASPYNYCLNNPVIFVDPDGRQVGHYVDFEGNKIGEDGRNDLVTHQLTNQEQIDFVKDRTAKGKTTSKTELQNEVGGDIFSSVRSKPKSDYDKEITDITSPLSTSTSIIGETAKSVEKGYSSMPLKKNLGNVVSKTASKVGLGLSIINLAHDFQKAKNENFSTKSLVNLGISTTATALSFAGPFGIIASVGLIMLNEGNHLNFIYDYFEKPKMLNECD